MQQVIDAISDVYPVNSLQETKPQMVLITITKQVPISSLYLGLCTWEYSDDETEMAGHPQTERSYECDLDDAMCAGESIVISEGDLPAVEDMLIRERFPHV